MEALFKIIDAMYSINNIDRNQQRSMLLLDFEKQLPNKCGGEILMTIFKLFNDVFKYLDT